MNINRTTNMKPTLLVLVAGKESRYGGFEQLEGLGPNGETLMDYSIYDAIKAGFGKIVFVIRGSYEKEFKEHVVTRYEKHISVELVLQNLEALTEGIEITADRKKQWGSNHALLMAKDVIKEPFGVINADDFYGRESFQLLAGQLKTMGDNKKQYCMIGYRLGHTLADSGSVARAICQVDDNNMLTKIVEREDVERIDGVPRYKDENGNWVNLTDTTLVSMNMWGFTPDYFELSADKFKKFLVEVQTNTNAEFIISTLINVLIEKKEIAVRVMITPSRWFGISYAKDRPEVAHKIEELIDDNIYPLRLF